MFVGTPIDWLADHRVVEVYCRCDPEVAIDRFMTRNRHPAHGDSRWTRAEGLANFRRLATLGPYGLGRVVVVDTDRDVDVAGLARRIRADVS